MQDHKYTDQLPDWIYFKLYVGAALGGLDLLITETVPQVLDQGGFDRWFFLRYFDESGLHLRLRLRAYPGTAADLAGPIQAICARGLEQLPSLPPSTYRPMVPMTGLGGSGQPAVPAWVGVRAAAYEPEFDKFGGERGMPIAEGAFEASSEIALTALRSDLNSKYSRKTLATSLMDAALDAFSLTTGSATFWKTYSYYWLGGEHQGAQDWRERFLAKGRELREQGIAIVAEAAAQPVEAATLVERWRSALQEAAGAYRRLGDRHDVSAEALAFQFVHLMNNRLGISVLEEAYLAALLELWTEERVAA